jgi:NADPH:quinone reductase-like Zn-dependent oxidoreductase
VAVVSSSTKISQAAALGADVVADSQDPDLVSKIQAAAPGLHHILDTVVTSETVQTAIQCLAQQSGIIATAIAYAGLVPEAVTVAPVFSGSIFGKTLKGEEDKVGAQIGQWLWQQLPIWLQSGAIRPLDYEVIGDLASIPVGLRRLEEHNAPRKLVVVP